METATKTATVQSRRPTPGRPPTAELQATTLKFARWLERTGCASYDPYDVWGTPYGLLARRLYYAGNPLGKPLVAPLLLLEIVCPGLRRLFVKKQRFATADGQLVLALLNLYAGTGEDGYLKQARDIADELPATSVPGYAGHCWGYPFDWQNNRGLWRRDTPFITSTPYCYEAFVALHTVTGEPRYLDLAASVARFVFTNLRDTKTGPNAAAGSYGPWDSTQVINASAYRAWVLFDAARRFGVDAYREKAARNLNFILQNQRADGSWLYALASPSEAFIDHFHTCFVLKNLFKLNRELQETRVTEAIRSGWGYYRNHLFDATDTPKSFAIQPRLQIARLEMYNVAEAITLGALLKDEIPEAFELAHRLAARLGTEWQLPDGHFVTRVYAGGVRHTFPFLRWPQAQLFLALTNLWLASGGDAEKAGLPAPERTETAVKSEHPTA